MNRQFSISLEVPKFSMDAYQYAEDRRTVETGGKVLSDEEKEASDRMLRKAYRCWRLCRNRTKVLGK